MKVENTNIFVETVTFFQYALMNRKVKMTLGIYKKIYKYFVRL